MRDYIVLMLAAILCVAGFINLAFVVVLIGHAVGGTTL